MNRKITIEIAGYNGGNKPETKLSYCLMYNYFGNSE